MRKAKKLLALLLALAMCMGVFAGCSNNADTESTAPVTESEEVTESTEPVNDTLVVATDAMDGRFSPFFYTAVPDEEVINMVHINGILTLDRQGAIVENAIEGETRSYNGTDYTYTGPANIETVENDDGTVDYNITLREGILFSDGTEATIDDVIFGMYVLADPTYDGSSSFFAVPIEGMTEYRTGMESLFDLLVEAGQDNTDFTYWDEATQTAFWADLMQAGTAFAQEIVDYCVAAGLAADSNDVATAAANWAFPDLPADATAEDFFLHMCEAYGWDLGSLSSTESAGSTLFDLMEDYDAYSIGVETGNSAPNISGIIRTGDYSMTVRLTQVDATAIYQLSVPLVPMHYYGDESLYDYENNSFGFPKGDLSGVKDVTGAPMGAGPYTFVSYENGVVTLDANPTYWNGEPKIAHMLFQVVQDADKVTAVEAGTVDVATPSFSTDTVEEIAAINGTEELAGDVITVLTTQYLGYGYIGINADNVSVGGDGGSDASKNLRKAIATVLAVYRDVVIDSYYGEYASVINYPISNTSWAAPQVTDEGYQVAFSTDINGDPIYTDGMTDEERYAAALEAALEYFEAAGYTVENGMLTAAPEGASLEYNVMVPGGGTGDHPNFMILSMAHDALATIGFNLVIRDLSDGTVTIGNELDAGIAQMWTMAWSATVDPDMYQIYYSDIANGGANPGGSNNYYAIRDAELDTLIMDARASLDQSYRKIIYQEALNIVMDWACEIPVYQRTDCNIFSTERVNVDTITPDITPFYGWAAEIQNMELN